MRATLLFSTVGNFSDCEFDRCPPNCEENVGNRGDSEDYVDNVTRQNPPFAELRAEKEVNS